jgi:hypothetical protein
VAYLNGTEIARSETMGGTGTPPPFNRTASGSHEAGGTAETSASSFASLLKPAPEKNVLAIQAHNISGLELRPSILPKVIHRQLLPGSIENSDPNGDWTFRFNPDRHDTAAKTIFPGTPYQINVPAGRTGIDGLKDAVDVIDGFVNHPSTAEFICLKLINKFVSDEISLRSYHDGTAPADLHRLSWMTPSGLELHPTRRKHPNCAARHLRTETRSTGPFWARHHFRAKVKTPIEFINSSPRSSAPTIGGTSLPSSNDDELGMHLFTRDDPDGWSEIGHDWIDTGTLLARIQFAQALPAERTRALGRRRLAGQANHITTAESAVDYFNQLLFQGSDASRQQTGAGPTSPPRTTPVIPCPSSPHARITQRDVRELVGIIFSMPQWHFQ